MKTKSLKVKFTKYDIDNIKQLADDYDITATSVLCKAIHTEIYIKLKQENGTRFFALDPDNTVYEVKF